MQAVGNPRQRSELIEKDSQMSIRRQCRLLHVHRSMIYYDLSDETIENLEMMEKLDHLYIEDPSAGSRRMSSYLSRHRGKATNRKRVKRLMRKMGMENNALILINNAIEKEDVLISSVVEGLPESASVLKVKCLFLFHMIWESYG